VLLLRYRFEHHSSTMLSLYVGRIPSLLKTIGGLLPREGGKMIEVGLYCKVEKKSPYHPVHKGNYSPPHNNDSFFNVFGSVCSYSSNYRTRPS
jgi:hypothetical protein